MAGGNVRVGVAYIDVRLGELKQFWGKLKTEVERNGPQIGQQLGDEVTKRLSVSKKDFGSLTDAIRGAIRDSGVEANRLKDVLGETGRQGGDAFLREFTPLLRASLARSGIEGRDKLLEAFDAGNISPRLVRTFRDALGSALDGVSGTVTQQGETAGRGFADGFGRGIRRVHEGIASLSQRLGLLSFQITNLGFTASAAFTAPVAALTTLAGAIGIQTASAIEDATVAFTTLLGTQQKANRFLRTLRDFAATSPIFDLDSVIQFSRNLLGAGVSANRIIPTLTALSAIAAAYGLDQDQLNRALRGFTQSLLLGRVYQEELNQITEAGIPIYDLLARAFGKTKQEIQKLVTDKKISPEQLFNQIVKLGNSGRFLEGLQNRASTLTGVWQQFKETLQANLADALTPQLPRIKEFLRTIDVSLREVLKNSGPFFDRVLDSVERIVKGIERLSKAYADLTPQQRDFIDRVILLTAAFGPAVIVIGAVAGAVSAIGGALAFVVGLLGGPATLIILGAIALIIGLGLAFREAYQRSQPFRDFVQRLLNFGRRLRDEFVPVVRDLALTIYGIVLPAFQELWRTFRDRVLPVLKQLAEDHGPKIRDVMRTIADAAQTLLPIAFAFFAAVIRDQVIPVLKDLEEFYKRNKNEIDLLIDVALILAKVMGVTLVSGVTTLIVVLGILVGIWGLLVRAVIGGTAWILDVLRAIKRLTDILTGAGGEARRFGNSFYQMALTAISWTQALLGHVARIPGQLRNIFKGAGTLLYQAGVNLIQGLINGVDARSGGLLGRLRSLAEQAAAIFNSIFQFGSPSKLTFQWGQWIVEGLQLGMDRTAGQLHVPAPVTQVGLAATAVDAPVAPNPGPSGDELERAFERALTRVFARATLRIDDRTGRTADLLVRGG